MSDNQFLSWIGKVINQNIYKGQFRSSGSLTSFQNEAYTRQLLREAKNKRHDLESQLTDIPFIILDTETTGFNAHQGDKIISISAAKVINGHVVDTYSTFINPERDIPVAITKLTGIEENDTNDAPTLSDVMSHFLSFVSQTIIIGYHIGHDLSFLNHFLWKYCRSKLSQQYIELKQIVEGIHKQKFETLDDALGFYGITCDARHTADGDVNSMVDLWQYLLKDFAKNHIETLIDLYTHLNR